MSLDWSPEDYPVTDISLAGGIHVQTGTSAGGGGGGDVGIKQKLIESLLKDRPKDNKKESWLEWFKNSLTSALSAFGGRAAVYLIPTSVIVSIIAFLYYNSGAMINMVNEGVGGVITSVLSSFGFGSGVINQVIKMVTFMKNTGQDKMEEKGFTFFGTPWQRNLDYMKQELAEGRTDKLLANYMLTYFGTKLKPNDFIREHDNAKSRGVWYFKKFFTYSYL